MIRDRGEPGIGEWRLPAAELEAKVAQSVARRLSTPAAAGTLLAAPTIDRITAVARRLAALAAAATENDGPGTGPEPVERFDATHGQRTITKSAERVAAALGGPERT